MEATAKPRYNRNESVGRPEMNRLLAAAAKLGLNAEELADMAGMDYRLIQRWENKWLKNKNFCPRRSTFQSLWKTLRDVTNEKDKKVLEEMRKEKSEPVMVALTQADLDLQQKVEQMKDPTTKYGTTQPQEQTAAQIIRSLINARLDKMTFVELALALAALEKK